MPNVREKFNYVRISLLWVPTAAEKLLFTQNGHNVLQGGYANLYKVYITGALRINVHV